MPDKLVQHFNILMVLHFALHCDRQKLLKPGGLILPDVAHLFAAGVDVWRIHTYVIDQD